eukprot:13432602-Alexandrium_andersonii.AAC.1
MAGLNLAEQPPAPSNQEVAGADGPTRSPGARPRPLTAAPFASRRASANSSVHWWPALMWACLATDSMEGADR